MLSKKRRLYRLWAFLSLVIFIVSVLSYQVFNINVVKTCVIDTRREISPGFDLGPFCDVMIHAGKAKGAEIALRTMSPQVIAFDEIGTAAELGSVSDMFCAGVNILTTAHAADINELLERSVTRRLLQSGAIKYVALLEMVPGGKIKILNGKDWPLCALSK